MRSRGYRAEVVEKWIPQTRRRKDLFGIGDVLAVGLAGVAIVQTTTRHNIRSRIDKITNPADAEQQKNLDAVRRAGITILVHGWWKQRGRWHLKEVNVS